MARLLRPHTNKVLD